MLILRAECCIFRADSIYCNHQQEMQQGYTIILWQHEQEQGRRWLYGWLYYKHQHPYGFRPESAG